MLLADLIAELTLHNPQPNELHHARYEVIENRPRTKTSYLWILRYGDDHFLGVLHRPSEYKLKKSKNELTKVIHCNLFFVDVIGE